MKLVCYFLKYKSRETMKTECRFLGWKRATRHVKT